MHSFHMRIGTVVFLLGVGLPALSEAGPPLLCHPFQTEDGPLLPWDGRNGWNSPSRDYDITRLPGDLLELLTPEAPVLTRMENMRRAALYAARDQQVAKRLLLEVTRRASAPSATPTALFDAGYLVETLRQARPLHDALRVSMDGYALVLRAIATGGPSPEMEFAAALMREGTAYHRHIARARAGATPLLMSNIERVER